MALKIIPTKQAFKSSLVSSLKGAGGGIGISLGRALLPNALGTWLGGVAAGAMVNGTEGTVIATVAGLDAISELFAGSGSSSAGNGGVM